LPWPNQLTQNKILSAADMMVCGGVAEMIHPAAMQRLLMS